MADASAPSAAPAPSSPKRAASDANAPSAPSTPSSHLKVRSWADDEDEDDEAGAAEFARQMMSPVRGAGAGAAAADEDKGRGREASPAPGPPSAEEASLASRLGGLSTDNSSKTPASSSPTPASPPPQRDPNQRPRPQVNNLFGKALAGARSDRQKNPGPTPPAAQIQAQAQASTSTSNATSAQPPTGPRADREGSFKGKEILGASSSASVGPRQGSEGKDTGKMNLMDAPIDGPLGAKGQQDNGWESTNWGEPASSNQAQPPAQRQEHDGGWGGARSNGDSNGSGNKSGNRGGDDGGWGGSASNGNGNDNSNGNGNGWAHNDTQGNGGAKGQESKRDTAMQSESGQSGLISNDFQVEVKLADLQADPNSPLYSAKAFEDLPIHEDLLKGIYGVGFKKPSKIQEKALPLLLMNPPRNLIGQSQSGTGKTAAFTLNMLSRVDAALNIPQAICLAPSRELARQIQTVVDEIGKFTSIKTTLAVPGGWDRNTKVTAHIIIGTPGTMVDMLGRGSRIFDPKMIRVFVLDEADQLVSMQGMGDQTRRIQRMLPRGTQNVLFSATFSDQVREFAASVAPEANQLYLRHEEVTVDAIKQLYLECDGEEQKYNALSSLYDVMSIGQSIVFCTRRDTADRIALRLSDEGHSVASLHGDKQTGERDQILDGFRSGKTKVLITTNVVARGIDIQQVNMVVNYDVPELLREEGGGPDIPTYIHRIGRTGRFGRKGCSVTFSHNRYSMEAIERIQQETGKMMKRIDAKSTTDLEQLEKALKAAMKGPA